MCVCVVWIGGVERRRWCGKVRDSMQRLRECEKEMERYLCSLHNICFLMPLRSVHCVSKYCRGVLLPLSVC